MTTKELPRVAATLSYAKDGAPILSFACPWGCATGRGKHKRATIHHHGGYGGERVSHCWSDSSALKGGRYILEVVER